MPNSFNPQNEDCPIRELSHRELRWSAQSHVTSKSQGGRPGSWPGLQSGEDTSSGGGGLCSHFSTHKWLWPNRCASVCKTVKWDTYGMSQVLHRQRNDRSLSIFIITCNNCTGFINSLWVVGKRRRSFLLWNFSNRSPVEFLNGSWAIFFSSWIF